MRTLRTVLLWGLVLAGVALPAAAAPTDYTEFELDELLDMDVVYGASTYEQKVSEAPSAVTVITAEEIAAYGCRTLDDVLSSVAGFYITKDRTYSYAGIRGFSRPADYNTRLLVLVDGHRLNDNIYLSGLLGTEFPIDLALVKRVEIIRGPSSSLYGSSAFFGVLNIVTKSPSDFEGGEVSAAAASYENFGGRVSYGKELTNGVRFLLAGTAYDMVGQDLYYPEYDTPESNNGVFENGDFDRAQRLFGKLQKGTLQLVAVYSSRDKGIPTSAWFTEFNDNRTRMTDDRHYVDLSWRKETGKKGELLLRGFYDHYTYLGTYSYDYADYEADPNADPIPALNKDRGLGRWIGSELRWTGSLGKRHRLVGGVELRHDLKCFQQNYDSGDDYYQYFQSNPRTTELGLFAQDELTLHEKLRLNLGLRHDRYEGFESTNPRLGLMLLPAERTTVKALYGTAFRAPNAYEMYYGDNENWQLWNPALQPEEVETLEVVLEQGLGSRLKGSLSWFHYNLDGLISQMHNEDDLLIYENMEAIQSDGVEIGLDARMLSGVRGRLSYSFQETVDRETDAKLSNSPQHMAKLNVLAPLNQRGTTAGIELQYMSERKTVLGGTVGAHTLTNLSLRHQVLPVGLTVMASVFNLFDVDYADPGSTEHVQEALPRDGRTFRLQMTYGW